MTKRRRHSADFKYKVALEVTKGTTTLSELASEYRLHPNQIGAWKRQLLEAGSSVFNNRQTRQEREPAAQEAGLCEQIGRLKLERYFDFYNYERPHQSLDYAIPATVHFETDTRFLC